MAAFISEEQSISAATATRIVEAEDFDRRVLLYDASGGTRLAFTNADAASGAKISLLSLSGQGGLACQFVLPADEELWVYNTSSAAVHYLVSTVS